MEYAGSPTFDYRVFFRYVKIFLATLAIFTNSALLAIMIRRRPKRYVNSLLAGYSIAMICISAGVAVSQALRLSEPFKPANLTTASKCAPVFLHIHLYAVGEPLLALSTFMIAFGNFLTIHGGRLNVRLTGHYVRYCFIIQACTVLGNLLVTWAQIVVRRDVPVKTGCFQKDLLDSSYSVMFFTGLALFGYITAAVEVISFYLLKFNKSSYSAIRLVQIRREVAVMKQTIVLVAFVFLSQTVPNTYKFIDNLGYHSVFWDRFVSVSSISCYSCFALHTLAKTVWNLNRVKV